MQYLDSWLAFGAVVMLGGVLLHLLHRNRRGHIGFRFNHRKVKYMNLKVNQSLPIKIVAEDKFGNPTGAFDATPAWGLTDPSLGSVRLADDGLSAVVNPSGKLGACQLQVSGVADGAAITGSLDLTFLPGDAVDIILQPGVPSDTPVDAPAPDPQG